MAQFSSFKQHLLICSHGVAGCSAQAEIQVLAGCVPTWSEAPLPTLPSSLLSSAGFVPHGYRTGVPISLIAFSHRQLSAPRGHFVTWLPLFSTSTSNVSPASSPPAFSSCPLLLQPEKTLCSLGTRRLGDIHLVRLCIFRSTDWGLSFQMQSPLQQHLDSRLVE